MLNALVAEGAMDAAKATAEIEKWAEWQRQNWHSFLEQTYGFINGIAVAIPMLFLARWAPYQPDSKPPRKWTLGAAAFITLIGVTYVNLQKNVSEWVRGLSNPNWTREITNAAGEAERVPGLWDIPYLGRWPGFDQSWTQLTPQGWFNLTYILIALAFVIIVRSHLRRPIAAIPRSALGRGQIMFLVLMWAMVIGNWERAIPGWHPNRLLTEWVIFINAIIATVGVLLWPKETEGLSSIRPARLWWPRWILAWIFGLALGAGAIYQMYETTRKVYGDHHAGHSGLQRRLGDEAEWKIKPMQKHKKHS